MRPFVIAVALALSGCVTSYQLDLMPRDSGKIYRGVAEDINAPEGRISITLEDRTYTGSWVQTVPERSAGYVSGGVGWGGWWGRRGGIGTVFTVDSPAGGEMKALLQAPDGSGLRCDFRGSYGRGGGVCRDDKGREYDVQIRPVEKR